MSNSKQVIRENFRNACFKRAGFRCEMCGLKSNKQNAEKDLDSHHIIDRNLLPSGGYCVEHAIALCKDKCHLKAEEFHSTGISHPGYSPEDLFKKIKSSPEAALKSSQKLK